MLLKDIISRFDRNEQRQVEIERRLLHQQEAKPADTKRS